MEKVLKEKGIGIKVLIITPTRELAIQCKSMLEKLS